MEAASTVEPQYNDCLDVVNKQGLTKLGIMSNQVWHDDPRRLVFMLSRYKFVSKMLSGKNKVAEVGCGDAFGSRIVLQEVKQLDVYDIDPIFVEDIKNRADAKWPLQTAIHNILTGPLPENYDAIYSLDVIEHIEKEVEQLYVNHIKQSLAPHGVAIIGAPTLESQGYASPQSKIGHVNCKSSPDFKKLFQQHFRHVFIFSMNDEVVHTGFYPMAHYAFALCCEPIN
ncbi:MAG: class I SAM-dependent methyltransferase [Gammaproteobacteria bacterium]|nr:class I SAM-dependent methyltransferase [Gammaproteobacteria bacterium]